MKQYFTKKNLFLSFTTILLACIFIIILLKALRDTGSMVNGYQEIVEEQQKTADREGK